MDELEKLKEDIKTLNSKWSDVATDPKFLIGLAMGILAVVVIAVGALRPAYWKIIESVVVVISLVLLRLVRAWQAKEEKARKEALTKLTEKDKYLRRQWESETRERHKAQKSELEGKQRELEEISASQERTLAEERKAMVDTLQAAKEKMARDSQSEMKAFEKEFDAMHGRLQARVSNCTWDITTGLIRVILNLSTLSLHATTIKSSLADSKGSDSLPLTIRLQSQGGRFEQVLLREDSGRTSIRLEPNGKVSNLFFTLEDKTLTVKPSSLAETVDVFLEIQGYPTPGLKIEGALMVFYPVPQTNLDQLDELSQHVTAIVQDCTWAYRREEMWLDLCVFSPNPRGKTIAMSREWIKRGGGKTLTVLVQVQGKEFFLEETQQRDVFTLPPWGRPAALRFHGERIAHPRPPGREDIAKAEFHFPIEGFEKPGLPCGGIPAIHIVL